MIKELRNEVEREKGKRDQLRSDLKQAEKNVQSFNSDLKIHEEALEVVRQVGLKTQQQLQYHISDMASLALESVFENPYQLNTEFVSRRNKTECDIYFTRNGEKFNPTDGGGGPIDIASFALRVASWSMQNPKSRNVLILDEPFKHLKGEEDNRRVLEMVSKVSKKLGLQVIMVSDERVSRQATIDATDRLFEVEKVNDKSKVRQL